VQEREQKLYTGHHQRPLFDWLENSEDEVDTRELYLVMETKWWIWVEPDDPLQCCWIKKVLQLSTSKQEVRAVLVAHDGRE